ncbi:indole-3-glycerol phosphate synthase TrpC [Archaeoglobus veneficus]|uniref:Indole-3-glycerol phosphate synthase n=1 Tax=Archaeoglobus veneficus (strain DSM 11195 / SNP6) TaxID=693661 RepID=F2KS88_ARCVS|nr:indole-3-glycerol phosphate synthase TrpC [Archaeoglobus veneficus]AEA48027.1 Indole-3-glycerol-phosphate synthase [Archaeoglobus veneficus SNP6]
MVGMLSRAIKKCEKNPVIAEVKVHSPKHGDLLRGRNEIDILRAYERAGAVGISYITESKNFKGSFEVFKKICSSTELPVLRKDFITSKEDVERTAQAGGSAVLLIARILRDDIPEFADFAAEHGLDALIEVHSEDELEFALEARRAMIGINNRDIAKLELDDGNVTVTEKIAPLIPDGFLKVSESGISSIDDLRKALQYTNAVLIGTAFMRAEDPEKIVRVFVEARI